MKLVSLAAFVLIVAPAAHAQLTLLHHFSANQTGGTSAGEIVSYDSGTKRLFVTSSDDTSGVHRINIFGFSNPAAPSSVGSVDFSSTFGGMGTMLALSSVAVDPMGRSFGVATLIPRDNTGTLGRIGFFDLTTGSSLGTVEAGFHPDSVSFSSDGQRLVVVNEGEFKPSSSINAPGSISIYDLSGITSGNLAALSTLTPTTRDFSAGNLASGVSLAGVRNPSIAAVGTSSTFIGTVPNFNDASNIDHRGMEPEYATFAGNKIYVSLQENNALAEYDIATDKWTGVTSLGKIAQRIDGSDEDGGIFIDKTVKGLPMPDTVAAYTVNGRNYILTANEGDTRGDDRDVSRFGDVSGNDNMNPILDTNYPSTNQNNVRANTDLGRLNVSRIDGDNDGDGKIDEITMIGTRSFSLWDVTDGAAILAWDSGSFFEDYIAANDAAGWVDTRSDDKGPEPEGLTIGTIDGKTFAFIGMERTNSIFMFDITNPLAPVFADYKRISDGTNTPRRPESLLFIPKELSPNGDALLVVGYEGDGSSTSERVGVFSVAAPVPEPGAATLLLVGGLGAALRRPRRK